MSRPFGPARAAGRVRVVTRLDRSTSLLRNGYQFGPLARCGQDVGETRLLGPAEAASIADRAARRWKAAATE